MSKEKTNESGPSKMAVLTLAFSGIAIILSFLAYMKSNSHHEDSAKSSLIKSTYDEFLQLSQLQVDNHEQAHLFAVEGNYQNILNSVRILADGKDSSEIILLSLQERAVADRIFTQFEHAFYQLNHAKKFSDKSRINFLDQVLDYYTGRLLRNPRLVWFWSENGGNLQAHYEVGTKDHYKNEIDGETLKGMDGKGPFYRLE